MQHFLYRITNKLNGRYYVGMHSTKNPDDGYLGSGRRIKAEVNKYGKENFEKVILEELPTRKALVDREREIVNDKLLEDPLCLNLKNGGEGSWDFVNASLTREQRSKGGSNSTGNFNVRDSRLIPRTEEMKAKWRKTFTENQNKCFLGKTHTEETKKKIGLKNSASQSGGGNSQFGTCWVMKNNKSLKIKKEQLDEYIRNGYSKGRKISVV